MDRRLILQARLSDIPGVAKAYFQPPPSLSMTYPCIVYERDAANTIFASNSPYRYTKRYQVTVIDRDPDSSIPDALTKFPMCTFSRHFTADNLHHDVFTLYF